MLPVGGIAERCWPRTAAGCAVSSCRGATASSRRGSRRRPAGHCRRRLRGAGRRAAGAGPAVQAGCGQRDGTHAGRPRVLSRPSASRRAAARTSNQQHDLYCTRVHSDDVGDVARWRRVETPACHDAGIRWTRRTPACSNPGSSRRVPRHARLVARTAALLRCGWRCIREGGSRNRPSARGESRSTPDHQRIPGARQPATSIQIRGARLHNLKGVDCRPLPLGAQPGRMPGRAAPGPRQP